jgi:hypothetical protein
MTCGCATENKNRRTQAKYANADSLGSYQSDDCFNLMHQNMYVCLNEFTYENHGTTIAKVCHIRHQNTHAIRS